MQQKLQAMRCKGSVQGERAQSCFFTFSKNLERDYLKQDKVRREVKCDGVRSVMQGGVRLKIWMGDNTSIEGRGKRVW